MKKLKPHTYSIIAFFVIAGPFAMSFDTRVFFIQYLPAVIIATLAIGAMYILWDVIVTKQGHWAFNDEYVSTTRILHLPPGEWLFFTCVPYATLFIFEVVRAYFGEGQTSPDLWWIQLVLSIPFFLLIIPFRHKGYTRLAFGSSGLFLFVSAFLLPGFFTAYEYWLFFLFSFIAFGLTNGIYTALPTITYNPKAVTGIRIGPIPAEDFFYNLSYLGLTLSVFVTAKQILGI